MSNFISEDDLQTFEGWLRYQAIDPKTLTPDQLMTWQGIYREAQQRKATTPKVGRMQLRAVRGEHRYAVAVEDNSNLWLTLWVRRSNKGEFFVMLPRGDREWNPHTSYHLDGAFHMKSYGSKLLPRKRQPLTGAFRGSRSLGTYYGHGPKSVGALCDPNAFSGVVKVPPGVLGPSQGAVIVDLVEPGCESAATPCSEIMVREIFRDIVPWVVITVGAPADHRLTVVCSGREFLSQAAPPHQMEALRHHERTGRPLDEEGFVAKLEKGLGRILHRRKPGPKQKLN